MSFSFPHGDPTALRTSEIDGWTSIAKLGVYESFDQRFSIACLCRVDWG